MKNKIPERLIQRLNNSLQAARESLDFIQESGQRLVKHNVEDLPSIEDRIDEAIKSLSQTKLDIAKVRTEQAVIIGNLMEAVEPTELQEHELAHLLMFINNLDDYFKALILSDPEVMQLALDHATPRDFKRAVTERHPDKIKEVIAILEK